MRVDALQSQSQASSPTYQAVSFSPFPPKTSMHSHASSALKAEDFTIPSSPSSLETASTASSIDEGQTTQRAPVCCIGCIASPRTRGRLRQLAPVLGIGCIAPPVSRPSNGASCHTCNISPLGYYLWWLWRCCHRHREPRPSHHRPRWCLCRRVYAVPDVHFSFAAATAVAAFSAASTAATAAGENSMASIASVGPLLPVSRTSVVTPSYSLDDVISADTVTRCKVMCFHLVFGRQSVDEDGV